MRTDLPLGFILRNHIPKIPSSSNIEQFWVFPTPDIITIHGFELVFEQFFGKNIPVPFQSTIHITYVTESYGNIRQSNTILEQNRTLEIIIWSNEI